jgi:exopolyphosphatase/guanosine-5'-triphosphate,3'-diphosphate pyrophosphatase
MGLETSRVPRPPGVPDTAPESPEAVLRTTDNGSLDRVGPGRRFPHHAHYAAIDLGTNNCRLLIARPAEQGFTVIDAFSRIVRLGEGVSATGRLSEAAIDRAVSALSVCAAKLRRRNVALARSVATEACRRAENGEAFVNRVYNETGIKLDIITAREEARLAVLGSHTLLEAGGGPALIFDIGGGSTELVLVDTNGPVPRIVDWHSAPWGVVSLAEWVGDMAHGNADMRREAYRRMRTQVADAFRGFAERVPGGQLCRLLGTSGTVTTLASVHLGLPRYDRSTIDGLVVPTETMRSIAERLSVLDLAERAALPCIGPERADLVVAGCAILEGILDIWPAERLSVADRGIREGILRSLIHGPTGLEPYRQADA